jgi:hypothetical protein
MAVMTITEIEFAGRPFGPAGLVCVPLEAKTKTA